MSGLQQLNAVPTSEVDGASAIIAHPNGVDFFPQHCKPGAGEGTKNTGTSASKAERWEGRGAEAGVRERRDDSQGGDPQAKQRVCGEGGYIGTVLRTGAEPLLMAAGKEYRFAYRNLKKIGQVRPHVNIGDMVECRLASIDATKALSVRLLREGESTDAGSMDEMRVAINSMVLTAPDASQDEADDDAFISMDLSSFSALSSLGTRSADRVAASVSSQSDLGAPGLSADLSDGDDSDVVKAYQGHQPVGDDNPVFPPEFPSNDLFPTTL
eukprot:TRINITY_DN612_c1_g8_i1.p1 TRINITY_DN612_c1_g8~~TRINITY_DN612_c1_g8_i1.p1  ORF type:complete len:269 (+),score=25.38 TRINITY_DN612_c1_g8_i1:55-861(+)